jgi:rare lipoprotein A
MAHHISARVPKRYRHISCPPHEWNRLILAFPFGELRISTHHEGLLVMNVAKAAAIALVVSTGAVSWISSTQAASAQSGLASWYGPGFQGRRTASGERFNTGSFTAAHRSLSFGTRVRVTNVRNGQSVVVRINDRGPHVAGRIIDLSKASARAIGMGGTARVKLAKM